MKSLVNPQLFATGCVAALVATASPAFAAQTEITAVRLNPTPTGVQLLLNIQGNSRPPVFTVNRGNSSVVDIADSQLRLPTGGTFTQANPVPGIRSIEVRQLDANTVRVTVNGIAAAPIGEVVRRNGTSGLVLNFARAQQPAGTIVSQPTGQPPSMGQTAPVVPPFLPRAVAPPVGDIAVGPVNASPDGIRLDSNERIPRLLLREAPVREVLALLARAAGVNVIFPEEGGAAPGATGGQTISLDIENESVQDVFNYVLRASGLQANRVGRTVFVGKNLPPDAQNRIVRTLRLNQIRATSTSTITNTITSKADTGGTVSGSSGGSSGGSTGSTTTAQTALNRSMTTTDNINQRGALEILQAYGANGGGGGNGAGSTGTLLTGLEVVADARTNTVTLIGTPQKVQTATTILTQLDVRKRQALINVKMIDINLLNAQRSNMDFQTNFGSGLFGLVFGTNGLNILRGTTPQAGADSVGIPATIPLTANTPIGSLVSNFFANLQLQLQNENAKILTNPTLLVQEGSAAQVNLTQEIFSGIRTSSTNTASGSGGNTASTSTEPIIRPAGVIFNVTLERVDDNGFVTLNLSPEVSAPSGTVVTGTSQGTITLLSQRRLETGSVRLRDGDTLLLSGIIQDQDRSSVTKVPILGDIPLLGRLFRRELNERTRRELVVLVTPRINDDSQANGFGYQYSPRLGNENLVPPSR